jgi:hypothetical protein
MRTRALCCAVAAICLTVGVSACGGDDSGDSSDTSVSVIEQVEAICDDWKETLDERGEFPVDGFDPENPAPDDLPAVGDYFASGHSAADSGIAELRELSPPGDVEADLEALVSALERQLESAKAQASAAQAGDAAAFTATLDDASSSQEAVKEAADELGAQSCSF